MKNIPLLRYCVTAVSAATLSTVAPSISASGFRIPEISIAGLGTANALVANHTELGAIPYNPAVMGFHNGTAAGAGLLVVYPTTEVNNAAGTTEADTDTPFLIPNLFFMAPIAQGWKFGLNVNAPFGLETKYKIGTFPAFAGPLAAVHPTVSQLKMVNINPNIAYQISPTMTIAVGLDYLDVDSVKFNSAGSSLAGDGTGWGANLGFLWASGPWSVGASYRSGAEIDIVGRVDARASGGPVLGAKTELDLPDIYQVGVRYAFTSDMAIEFDIDHTHWSSFDKLTVKATTTIPGTILLTSVNDWEDATAYRIGVTWNLSPKTQLRFGYTFDQTGQEEKNFSARIPDADRQLFSFGVKQDVGGWDFEGGVMYVLWDDRKISNTAPPGPDPNGTSAYNGKYESDAWLIGLGVVKKF